MHIGGLNQSVHKNRCADTLALGRWRDADDRQIPGAAGNTSCCGVVAPDPTLEPAAWLLPKTPNVDAAESKAKPEYLASGTRSSRKRELLSNRPLYGPA